MVADPDVMQFLWAQVHQTLACAYLAQYDCLSEDMALTLLRIVATRRWTRLAGTWDTLDLATLRTLTKQPYLPSSQQVSPPPVDSVWHDLYLSPEALAASEAQLDALLRRLLTGGARRRYGWSR